MIDKQPDSELHCSIRERLNRKGIKECTRVIVQSDEPIGHRYFGRIDGYLSSLSAKRQSTKATMTLAHWVCNERNRRGTALGHLPCNERNRQLYSEKILF